MPRKITNEDLVRMIKRGFDETSSKAELEAFRADVSKRFEDVDKQFEGVDKRLDGVDKRLERLEMEASHTNAGLSVIERDVAEIRKHFVYFY